MSFTELDSENSSVKSKLYANKYRGPEGIESRKRGRNPCDSVPLNKANGPPLIGIFENNFKTICFR